MILDGLRVLDFTQYLAGPTVTRLMAEMGAEIIKIERAPGGDPSRGLPAVKNGRSGYFVQQNLGKRSVCLDMDSPQTDAIVRALVAKVDVVVENFGPGVMEKRGWDYASLKNINPRLLMASISAFGRKSPLSHKTGFDLIAQAFAGVMAVTGPRGGSPHPVGMGMADVSSGVHAFASIGYALFNRERTGEGQWMDISMIDCLFAMHELNNEELRQKEIQIRDRYVAQYSEKEQLVRTYYKKLIALANKISRQKAQLQEAKKQFESKLASANQLYREVEEMRNLLSDQIVYMEEQALEDIPQLLNL